VGDRSPAPRGRSPETHNFAAETEYSKIALRVQFKKETQGSVYVGLLGLNATWTSK
jgi:hypothetical protein